MKKNNKNLKGIRKKLTLNLQHIVVLTPLEMSTVHGASTQAWSCTNTQCEKPN